MSNACVLYVHGHHVNLLWVVSVLKRTDGWQLNVSISMLWSSSGETNHCIFVSEPTLLTRKPHLTIWWILTPCKVSITNPEVLQLFLFMVLLFGTRSMTLVTFPSFVQRIARKGTIGAGVTSLELIGSLSGTVRARGTSINSLQGEASTGFAMT